MSELPVTVKGKERNLKRYVETGTFLDVMSITRECELNIGLQLPQYLKDVIGKYEGELVLTSQ